LQLVDKQLYKSSCFKKFQQFSPNYYNCKVVNQTQAFKTENGGIIAVSNR